MVRTAYNGTVQLAYETVGPTDGHPLLLVMGLDSPMQWWPDGFCADLAEHGFHVARFDDRDCGQSTRYHRQARRRALPVPDPVAIACTKPTYTVTDMVDDAIAVLDALDWDSAHIVGMSLGASVALGTAIRHPARVRTVVSMMGLPAPLRPATAARYVDPVGLRRFARLASSASSSHAADVRAQVETARMLASPRHRFDEEWAYTTAVACRKAAAGDPGTAWRQLSALFRDRGLLSHTEQITAPLLILHGADDPLIKPAASAALARRVHGSRCVIYPDMGHEVPRHLWTTIADEIASHAGSAK